MVNINSLRTVCFKGASLLRKDCGLSISQAQKIGIRIPEEAKTFDVLKVGRNFKPEDYYTDIFTFRDSSGNMVKRYIKKVDGKNVVETTKSYKDLCPDQYYLNPEETEYIDINTKNVRAYVRENGRLKNISEDNFSVTEEPKPTLTHSRKEITPDGENIFIEQRKNGQPAKFINNNYVYSKYDDKYLYLAESKASSPELTQIAKNSYFLPFVSSDNKFAKRMADANISDRNFLLDPEVILYREASTKGGFYNNDAININLKSPKDLTMPRETLTEIIGHEVGHAKWDERCMLYDLDDEIFMNSLSKEDINNIEKYKSAINEYVSSKKDFKKYYNNFAEKTARKEGSESVKKYLNLEEDLGKEFPYKHFFQFYQPKDDIDDLQSISSIINSYI